MINSMIDLFHIPVGAASVLSRGMISVGKVGGKTLLISSLERSYLSMIFRKKYCLGYVHFILSS